MYLVFDLGGTFIKYAVITETGEIKTKSKIPTPAKVGDTLENLLEALDGVYNQVYEEYKPEGIAMSLPGQIDVDNGIVYGGGRLTYLHEVNLGKLLSERFGNIPVALENDGKCAALAEIWLGNAKDCNDACVVVFI